MTAVEIQLCGCGHAERMHERDDAADNGRGVCMQRSCGCSEYRPGAPEVAAVVSDPTPGPGWSCQEVGCFRSFTSPQGLAMHRRRAHEGFDPNAKPEQDHPPTERPAEAPTAGASESGAAAGTPQPVAAPPAGSAAVNPPAAADSASTPVDDREPSDGHIIRTLNARLVFGGDHESYLEVNLRNVGPNEFTAFTQLVLRQLTERTTR